jgi:hypothetical protein
MNSVNLASSLRQNAASQAEITIALAARSRQCVISVVSSLNAVNCGLKKKSGKEKEEEREGEGEKKQETDHEI